MNITDSFIAGIQGLCSKDLPVSVIDKVLVCFLDYLSCAIGGSKSLQDSAMRNLLIDERGRGRNHVVGCAESYPLAFAALINGFSAHHLDFDDGHRKGAVHIGAPVFSALLAIAEVERISSDDFIKGIVAGYESTARLACAVQPGCRKRGYHATGVCGTVGAAIGVAVAMHFTDMQMKTTISAAVTGSAGVLEMQENASELKPYNVGRAAMDAVIASYMGKAGFQGPDDPIGGNRGFLKIVTDNPKYEYLSDFSSNTLQIELGYMKLYAACRHAHPAIEAALAMRGKFRLDEITDITILTYKQATEGHSHKIIPSISSAKMSIPFSVAIALVTGSAGLEAFSDKTIKDKAVISIMRLISIKADDELSSIAPQKRSAIVQIMTSHGLFTHRVDYPKGEPENPLGKEDIELKFRLLASYYGLTKEQQDILILEVFKRDFSVEKILSVLCI